MSAHFWNHTARSPRHTVVADSTLRFGIEKRESGNRFEVELHDLSRRGICVQTNEALTKNETLMVTCYDPADGFLMELPAKVRWQKNVSGNTGDSETVVGCEFNESMGWESIGELFLRGAIANENPTHPFETN